MAEVHLSQPIKLLVRPKGFTLPTIPGPPTSLAKLEREVLKEVQLPSDIETKPPLHPLLEDELRVFPRDSIDALFDYSDEDAERAKTS
jgi:hypothetical protein